MSESTVKGEVFIAVLDQVISKWGKRGLDTIGYEPGGYSEEQWYPFREMCELLSRIKANLGNDNPLSVYLLGFGTVKDDARWQELFRSADPAHVFLTTQRQDGQYRVGVMTASALDNKHVRIDLECDMPDALWLEFYRGRLQGVLELTGRTGVAHLLPPEEDPNVRTYDIKWG